MEDNRLVNDRLARRNTRSTLERNNIGENLSGMPFVTLVKESLVHEDEVRSIMKDFNVKFGIFGSTRLDFA